MARLPFADLRFEPGAAVGAEPSWRTGQPSRCLLRHIRASVGDPHSALILVAEIADVREVGSATAAVAIDEVAAEATLVVEEPCPVGDGSARRSDAPTMAAVSRTSSITGERAPTIHSEPITMRGNIAEARQALQSVLEGPLTMTPRQDTSGRESSPVARSGAMLLLSVPPPPRARTRRGGAGVRIIRVPDGIRNVSARWSSTPQAPIFLMKINV